MGKVSRLVGFAERTGRYRGFHGRSSTWLGVWVAAAGYRRLRDLLAEEPVVIREALQPGQQLVVTHYKKGEAPPEPEALSRRRRRKARKADKQARAEQKQARRREKRSGKRGRKRDEAAGVAAEPTGTEDQVS